MTVSLLAYVRRLRRQGDRPPGQQDRRRRRRPAVGPGAGEHAGSTCSARRTATTPSRSSRCRSTATPPADRRHAGRGPRPGPRCVLSWFGVPEPGFGGMGGGGRMGFGSGGYAYEPIGGAEALEGVRVPIWSTKCFDRPLVRARRRRGRRRRPAAGRHRPPRRDRHQPPGRAAERRHRSPSASRSTPLGTIAPGTPIRVELQAEPAACPATLRDSGRNYLSRQPWDRQRVPDQPARPDPRPDVPRQRRDRDLRGAARQQHAPRPRPDRPARPRPADARGAGSTGPASRLVLRQRPQRRPRSTRRRCSA